MGALVALVCAVTACQPSPAAQVEADASEPAVEEVASTVEDVPVDEDILSGYTEPEAPSVEPGVGLEPVPREVLQVLVQDRLRLLVGDGSSPAALGLLVLDHEPPGPAEVVRGADLLVSTARQLLLYRALGFQPPEFFHCELLDILKKKKKKQINFFFNFL